MESKKHYRKVMKCLLLTFLILVAGIIIYSSYLYIFDHKERNYSVGEENEDFTVSIAPKMGQTDHWVKNLEENGTNVEYNGSIYGLVVDNIGQCNISKWAMQINIDQDCFLNNAWCGKVEIHQNKNESELIQTIDLRNFKEDELELDYKITDPDLMIPLYKGDYIIYYPDYATDEYPILSGDSDKLTTVECGLIFYTKGDQQLTFDDYQIQYYLQKNYKESWGFVLICIGVIAWLISVIIFASIEFNMRKTHLRFVQDERIIRQSIGVFIRFFEAKDNYTNGHSQRVAKYVRMIAEEMDMPEETCRQIYYIGLMHDCGKCYIPDEILKKPGKLTSIEYEIIKGHTVKGAEMLEDFTAIDHVKEGVLYHHERYDGKGYPTGLSGEEIPLIGRMICVADAFDAMNSRRCYRDVLGKTKIVSELETNSGKQFDPKIVKAFLHLVEEGKIEFTKDE